MSKAKSTSTKTELEIKSLLKDSEAAKKTIAANTKKTVKLLEKLIKETHGITAIRWQQYTPGFNDGEACEFSVNDLEIKFDTNVFPVNEETKYNDKSQEEDVSDFVDTYSLKEFFDRQADVINYKDISAVEQKTQLFFEIHGTLVNITGALKDAFGDNVQITVTKNGIEKEDWDCGF